MLKVRIQQPAHIDPETRAFVPAHELRSLALSQRDLAALLVGRRLEVDVGDLLELGRPAALALFLGGPTDVDTAEAMSQARREREPEEVDDGPEEAPAD